MAIESASVADVRWSLRRRRRPVLARLRLFLTGAMVLSVGSVGVAAVVWAPTPLTMGMTAVSAVAVTAFSRYWEQRPPLWLAIGANVSAFAAWVAQAATWDPDSRSTLLTTALSSLALSILASHLARWRPIGYLVGLVLVVAPAALIGPAPHLGFLAAVALLHIATALSIILNRWWWRVSIELDESRMQEAIARERFRFAADLHDIQGHTLHVIRLKMQLVDRLLEADPASARTHLSEAQELVAETLANTRSLAYGERRVSLASELANARALFQAASIEVRVRDTAREYPHEELFGLLVRETTTNILRHATATRVDIEIDEGSIRIVNDGSRDDQRELSGLARLAERFAAAGGFLDARADLGRFTTEAVAR